MTPRTLLLLALLTLAAPLHAAPQEQDEPDDRASGAAALLSLTGSGAGEGAFPSISAEKIEEVEPGIYLLTGYADMEYGILRIQADRIVYDVKVSVAEAEGNVVLIQGEGTLAASRMVIRMDTGEATLWDVTGYTPPYYQFRAERLERIDEELFYIYGAVFTTCTQPIPYWSFKVKQGRVRMEHYARLRGVAFKSGRMPIIWLPYVVWPVKQDRASGLLMPQFGVSNERGFYAGNAIYWVMRRNMDATFFVDYYHKAGFAGGLEYRYVPNEHGSGIFTGYYLPSDVDDAETTRYRARYRADQKFGEKWAMIADVNVVSDADFYLDFEHDFAQAVNVQELSNLNFTRAWSYYALNMRAERRRQFSTGSIDDVKVIQRRLPEFEIRSRSRQLGNTPLYLSFTGSGNGLQREEAGLDADYRRLDGGFTLSASLSPASWFDITPSLSARSTHYTQRADDVAPDGVADVPLRRDLLSFGMEFLGPKLYRVFEPKPDSGGSRFKNTIEPRLIYTYISQFDDADDIILYDEIDTVAGDVSAITWSLTTRLLRKQEIEMEDDETDAEPAYDSAREIASVELRQTRSFNSDLLFTAEQDPDLEIPLRGTQQGPISLLGRYNPTSSVSTDMRVDYDVLFERVRSISISAGATSPRHGRLRASYYIIRDLEQGMEPNGTLRLGGGSAFWRKKISWNIDLSYDLDADMLDSQRYRIGYNSQCCGFELEYLEREFGGLLGPAQELRFVISLQGIGTFLDLNSRLN